ncbi:two-component regulator propeller domain-containing protein [Ekhidna sp.]|uniref:ligand-binding sensor domain-containing protein n=1 Tax=Ekhidna sp. TaxID=2608089 RepID=UPI003298EFD1
MFDTKTRTMVTIKKGLFIFFGLVIALISNAGPRDFTTVLFNADRDFNGVFIYTIVQDDDGFLWIGCNDGLYRFDGQEMLNLRKKDTTISSTITASTISNDGHVYLGYIGGGISIVEHGRYRKLLSNEELPNRIEQLKVDDSNALWGLTRNQGMVMIDGDSIKRFQLPILNELVSNDFVVIEDKIFVGTNEGVVEFRIKDGDLIPAQLIAGTIGLNVSALYQDKDDANLLWVGTNDGLYRYRISQSEINLVEGFPEHVQISSIAEDDLNTLWVGTYNHGLVEVDLKRGEIEALTYFNTSSGFESNEIQEVYVDNENEVWVGTFGRGLVQLNRAYFHHYELYRTIGVQGIHSIANYQEDELLLATDKGIVHVYHKPQRDSLIFEKLAYTEKYSFTSLAIMGQEVWAGTKRNGVVRIDLENGQLEKILLNPLDPLNTHLIRDIQVDLDSNVWVSAAGNGVYHLTSDGELIEHYNTRSGFYHNEIFSIYPDRAGNVWFGSHAVGLAVLQRDGQMKFLTKDKVFPAFDINSIIQDESGKIWIATAGSGIYSFDGENFKQFTEEENDLLSNFCNAVMVDNIGQIWVGHRLGISLIQPDYELVRVFSHPSELGETESELNSVIKDVHGNVFFGNPFGITKVNLPHFNFKIDKRETHIKDIRLFFQEVDLLEHTKADKLDNILPSDLRFSHEDNHLSFDFVSINLRNPDAIYYQFTLEGYDKTWSRINKSNIATYTNLDPGKYTFKVKESDHPELWSDAEYSSITFSIAPPYWRTWWFYLLQIAFFLFIMYMTLVLSSRIKSQFVTRLMVYVSLFILFEYVHTEVEPYVEKIAGETPIFQVGTNLLLALILLPVELRLSGFLKKRALSRERVDEAIEKNTE